MIDLVLAVGFLAAAAVAGIWWLTEREQERPRPRAGVCRLCGCTEERACPGGCSWANATRTICSRCMKVTDW